ncbi:MAG TPA: VOC family protein [Acidimicrobiia bacterium]|nr:VOC family protein [Acidimicrobiia bacterium]
MRSTPVFGSVPQRVALDDPRRDGSPVRGDPTGPRRPAADRFSGHAGGLSLPPFHHVALTVSAVDRSAAWYRDVLDFEERFREEGEERRGCVMRFAGGGYSLGLFQHRPPATGTFDARRTGLDHLAFTVDRLGSLQQWAERPSAANVDHSGVVEIPPGAILNFRDPDGIALALFWDRAVSD